MEQQKPQDNLSEKPVDYVTSAAKSILGVVPFAGSLLAEIAGSVIPNQRIERIANFAQQLEVKLGGIDRDFVRSQVSNENFTDLVEEGLRQAASSVSEERRQHIAELIANSVKTQDISFLESKHLLRILGEINDIEVIRLGSYQYRTIGSGGEYREKHREVLTRAIATMASSEAEVDKATLQASYDNHLERLGLLKGRYAIDISTKQPEFDRFTGEQKRQGYELASLGRLLLKHVGILDEGAI